MLILSQDLLHQWLPNCLWLPNCWWPWLMEQLNLSNLSSRRASATNAHLWASGATTRASLQSPLSGPWNGHRWSRPSAGTLTGGLAWKHWQIFALVSPPAGHIPAYNGGAPWLRWGSPGGYSPPSPHHMNSCWVPSSVITLHYTLLAFLPGWTLHPQAQQQRPLCLHLTWVKAVGSLSE